MKIPRSNLIGGLLTTVLSAVVSYAMMFIMAGSHSGTDDYLRMAPAIVLLGCSLPLAGGFYLRRFWPVASLAFSWILIAMLINRITSDTERNKTEILVVLAGIAISAISAKIGSRFAAKQKEAP